MHLRPSLAFVALTALALANPTPPDSSALVARQFSDPQINVFCIDNNIPASANVTDAFDSTCTYLASRELAVGEQVTNVTCFDEKGVCITTLLVHKCGKPGTTTTIDYDSCMALFALPYHAVILHPCKNGGYVGSPAPGACWTALSVATLKEAENRLPALDEKAFTPAAYYIPAKKMRQMRQEPASAVLSPLSGRAELLRPDDDVMIPNETPLPPATSDLTLLRRQADDAGVECSKDTFTDVFEAFCQLYEYCPFLNDEAFNLTQQYDVLGQNVMLSVQHTGACITGGKTGHDTCVMLLEETLEDICRRDGMSGDQTVPPGGCWDFDISIEPN